MAATCGPATLICVFILILVAASLAIAGKEEEQDDVALVRSVRSANPRRRGGSRGNEEVAVDGTGRPGRRRAGGNRGNRGNGGGRGGRGRGRGQGRGRGRGRGRGSSDSPFNRRAMRMMGRLANANAEFSLSLYNQLASQNPDLIFSPHSIHTAMTMTYLGARQQTAKQMLKVLGLKKLRKQKAHEAYAALTNSLTEPGNVTLNIANAVYVKPNLPIEDAFRTGLQEIYKAEFDHFDFSAAGGPEEPINTWVSEKTEGKIQDLLGQGTITPLTAMVIVNAIYFKGGWKDKFDERMTTEQPFHQSGIAPVTVPLMTRTAMYNYTQSDPLQSHIIELPYQGDRFSMFVVLPLTQGALGQVEQILTLEALNSALDAVTPTRVRLYLPRFKSETKLSLKETLLSMGMTNPFDASRAKFTGICTVYDLFISDVIHQAVVEVTEEGTEAAAATGVIITLTAAFPPPPPPVEVRADHPFLYLIRDNLTKTVLFVGKYSAMQ